MTTMRVVGECFFWYRLTRVFPDKFHRAVKRLCVCVIWARLFYCLCAFAISNQHKSDLGEDGIILLTSVIYTPSLHCSISLSHCSYFRQLLLPLSLPSVGMQNIVNSMSVHLSVCSHISKTTWLNFNKFSVHVHCGRGLVLLRQHCDTLCMVLLVLLTTSCFYITSCIIYGASRVFQSGETITSETTAWIPTTVCSVIKISITHWSWGKACYRLPCTAVTVCQFDIGYSHIAEGRVNQINWQPLLMLIVLCWLRRLCWRRSR